MDKKPEKPKKKPCGCRILDIEHPETYFDEELAMCYQNELWYQSLGQNERHTSQRGSRPEPRTSQQGKQYQPTVGSQKTSVAEKGSRHSSRCSANRDAASYFDEAVARYYENEMWYSTNRDGTDGQQRASSTHTPTTMPETQEDSSLREQKKSILKPSEFESSTPQKTMGDGEPQKTSGDGTPQKTTGDDTPQKTTGDGTPQKTMRDGTPQKTMRDGTPQKTTGDGAPRKTTGDRTPQKTTADGTPQKTTRDGTPQKTTGDGAPQKTTGDGTPQKTTGDETLQKTTRDGTPQKTTGDGILQKITGDGTPQKTTGVKDQPKGIHPDSETVPEKEKSRHVSYGDGQIPEDSKLKRGKKVDDTIEDRPSRTTGVQSRTSGDSGALRLNHVGPVPPDSGYDSEQGEAEVKKKSSLPKGKQKAKGDNVTQESFISGQSAVGVAQKPITREKTTPDDEQSSYVSGPSAAVSAKSVKIQPEGEKQSIASKKEHSLPTKDFSTSSKPKRRSHDDEVISPEMHDGLYPDVTPKASPQKLKNKSETSSPGEVKKGKKGDKIKKDKGALGAAIAVSPISGGKGRDKGDTEDSNGDNTSRQGITEDDKTGEGKDQSPPRETFPEKSGVDDQMPKKTTKFSKTPKLVQKYGREDGNKDAGRGEKTASPGNKEDGTSSGYEEGTPSDNGDDQIPKNISKSSKANKPVQKGGREDESKDANKDARAASPGSKEDGTTPGVESVAEEGTKGPSKGTTKNQLDGAGGTTPMGKKGGKKQAPKRDDPTDDDYTLKRDDISTSSEKPKLVPGAGGTSPKKDGDDSPGSTGRGAENKKETKENTPSPKKGLTDVDGSPDNYKKSNKSIAGQKSPKTDKQGESGRNDSPESSKKQVIFDTGKGKIDKTKPKKSIAEEDPTKKSSAKGSPKKASPEKGGSPKRSFRKGSPKESSDKKSPSNGSSSSSSDDSIAEPRMLSNYDRAFSKPRCTKDEMKKPKYRGCYWW